MQMPAERLVGLDPTEMLKSFTTKYTTLEYTYDFFTPDNYKKYFHKDPDPTLIVCRAGIWGVLRVPDGKTRMNVPQIREGETAALHTEKVLIDKANATYAEEGQDVFNASSSQPIQPLAEEPEKLSAPPPELPPVDDTKSKKKKRGGAAKAKTKKGAKAPVPPVPVFGGPNIEASPHAPSSDGLLPGVCHLPIDVIP